MSPLLSLRGIIGFLAAAAVAIVAVVTLTITLTTSLAALRSVGKLQATSLAQNARDLTANRFVKGTDAVTNLISMVNSRRWNYPSDDPAQWNTLQEITRTAFIASPLGIDALTLWFYDNSQVWLTTYNASLYRELIVTASSFATTFPNSVVTGVTGVRRWDNSAPVTDAATIALVNAEATYPVFRLSDGLWQYQALPASGNGVEPIVSGVFPSVLKSGVLSSIAMGGPCYRLGDSHQVSNVFAIAGVTFTLTSLNYFLADLGGTPHTVAVLYQSTTYLLATSLFASRPFMVVMNVTAPLPPGCELTNVVGDPAMVCRSNLTAYGYAPLADLASRHSDVLQTTTQYVDELSLADDNYFVAVMPVPIAFPGMALWLALTIPESDIIGNVVQGRNTAIGITCGIFVLVVALNIVLVSLLLRPLSRIAERMIDASNLEDDGADDEPSMMAEVQELQTAYFEMNTELNRIRSFVPQTILAAKRIEATGVDLDLDFASGRPTDTPGGTGGDSSSVRSGGRTSRRASSNDKVRSTSIAVETLGVAPTLRVSNGTVLLCNMAGFHAAAALTPHDTIVTSVNDVVTAVGNAVTNRGGVFSFHGDRFFASFNAAIPCAAHARRAVEAAVELQDVVPAMGLKLPMYCSVATGTFMMGSLGSATVKTLSVMGHAVSQAAAMEAVGREFKCFVLATQRTVLDVAVHFDYRFIDMVPLQYRDGQPRPTLVAEVRKRVVDGSMSAPGANEAEWLYVVTDGAGRATERNRVFEVLVQGAMVEAQTLYAALPPASRDNHAADGLHRAMERISANITEGR